MYNLSATDLSRRTLAWLVTAVLAMVAAASVHATGVAAETDSVRRVQVVTGEIEPRSGQVYVLQGLLQGDELYVYMEGTSGNLDPFVALVGGDEDVGALLEGFQDGVADVIESGGDPLTSLPAIVGRLTYAWDDDSGEGYDAAFAFVAPADGDYRLLSTGAPWKNSFGEYRLLLGLNAPEVLRGSASSIGDPIAVLDREVFEAGVYAQELTGTLTIEIPEVTFQLRDMKPGDRLYAYAEGTSGDLTPILALRDFGDKAVSSANLSGARTNTALEYSLENGGSNYSLVLSSTPLVGEPTTGDYRLLLGINNPDVLTGHAEVTEMPVVKGGSAVKVGVALEQITNVDQIGEKFSAVAELQLEWRDPALAFRPDECQCSFQTYTGDSFANYADSKGIEWPQFQFQNQQGNRWIQNRYVVIWPDGEAAYYERFTTDFQAPLFDFTRFPFDKQQLYIRVDSLYPEEYFVFTASRDNSAVGNMLGEEEWYVVDYGASTNTLDEHATYSLHFQVQRHLTFYVFRIIVPIVLIIIVSWITFFLKDYGKRVDVSGANLLVFVAFNFTVSGELPRLGYLTFMDAVLVGVFAISAFVVVWNVILRRLELADTRDIAERIDRWSIWIYPLAYALMGAVLTWYYLLRPA